MGGRALLVPVLALGLLAGCEAYGEDRRHRPPSAPASVVAPSLAACPVDNRYPGSRLGFPEVAGASGNLWALLFLDGHELLAGRRTKIAFRMTGSGDLTLHAVGPAGARVTPDDGPEPHSGSNWERPGDEWGSSWTFPTPGCWRVRAERTDGSHDELTLRAG